jgi:hypothetical protein
MGRESTESEEHPALDRESLHEIYYWLQLTREVEQVLTNLYRQNKVIGGLYRSLGQEAGAVGTAYRVAAPGRRDGRRDLAGDPGPGRHAHDGRDAADVMRQYMAKADGPTGGRETNVHFSDYEKGYVGLISHLGVMVEIMTGVALTFKLRGEDRVALVYSGDGMTSTGAFHEGFNMAAVQKLPLVLVVENNGYAYSTPTSRQTAVDRSWPRRAGTGPGRERGRERRGGGVRGDDPGGGARPCRRRSHAARAHDVPPEGARGARRPEVRAGGGDRGVGGEGPGDEVRAAAAGGGLGHGGRAGGDPGPGERGGGAAREAALASDMPAPESGIDDVYDGEPGWVPWTRRAPHDPHEA